LTIFITQKSEHRYTQMVAGKLQFLPANILLCPQHRRHLNAFFLAGSSATIAALPWRWSTWMYWSF